MGGIKVITERKGSYLAGTPCMGGTTCPEIPEADIVISWMFIQFANNA